MNPVLKRRTLALFVYFFIPGLALASWVTRTPAIRDAIGASIAQMGLVLAGLSVGSMCGVLLSGHIIKRRGTRFTMQLGLALVCASMVTVAWGTALGWQPVVALGLGFFGLGMGTAEIAINMDAAQVEHDSGEHVMHALHGSFSLGTLVGALLGLAANALELPVVWHLCSVFAVLVVLQWAFRKHVPAGYGRHTAQPETARSVKLDSVWRDPRVLLIGLIVFAMGLTEGSAYDWLPILLVDEHGFSAALGALIFVVFAAMMTLGRFSGGFLLRRFGRLAVIRTSITLAGLGVACIALGQGQWLAGAGVLCWGIGAALGFPIALSAAAEGGGAVAERVKAVAIIGYVAILVGPPSLGFVGEHFGLRGAMLLVLGLIVVALLVTGAIRPAKPRA